MSQSYADLVGRFPLDPIQDEAHLDRAIAFLDPLLPPFDDEGVQAYVLALGDAIHEYESKVFDLGEVSPGEMLGYLMELRGIGPAEVAQGTGVGATEVAAILKGVRPPMQEEMASFGKLFGVNASTFNA